MAGRVAGRLPMSTSGSRLLCDGNFAGVLFVMFALPGAASIIRCE